MLFPFYRKCKSKEKTLSHIMGQYKEPCSFDLFLFGYTLKSLNCLWSLCFVFQVNGFYVYPIWTNNSKFKVWNGTNKYKEKKVNTCNPRFLLPGQTNNNNNQITTQYVEKHKSIKSNFQKYSWWVETTIN